MTPNNIREIDARHNTKVLSLMVESHEYKTWCYVAQKWVTVTRQGDQYTVKMGRKSYTFDIAGAVNFIITASHGSVGFEMA